MDVIPYYISPIEVPVSFRETGKAKVSGIQVFKAGKYKHPIHGNIELGEKDFDLFIKHFNADIRKIQCAVNLNHSKEEAAGWIQSLEKRNDGRELWAIVEWTEFGLSKISSKEYRYISAEFFFEYEDNETGRKYPRVFTGAALTNYPFIKGMKAVELSETFNEISKGQKSMNLQELKIKLSEFGIDFDKLQRDSQRLGSLETALSEQGCSLTEVVAKLAELSDVKAKLSAVEKERDSLKVKVELSEKAIKEAQFSSLVERGMKEGKLTKAFAETKFKEIFDKQGAEFAESLLNDLPKSVSSEFSGHTGGDGKKTAQAELEEIARGIAEKEQVEFHEALSRAMSRNPKLAARYDDEITA